MQILNNKYRFGVFYPITKVIKIKLHKKYWQKFATTYGDLRDMDKHEDQLRNELDYAAIGRRIRDARKKLGMTQEALAELADLSIPHMSNIENGKTKVSLPSLVWIANALRTTADALLYDNLIVLREAFDKDFKDLLEDCSVQEKEFIYDMAKELKKNLKK